MSFYKLPKGIHFSCIASNNRLASINVYHRQPMIGEGLSALMEKSGYRILNNGQPINLQSATSISILEIEWLVDPESAFAISQHKFAESNVIVVASPEQLARYGHLLPEHVAGLVISSSMFKDYRMAIENVLDGMQFIDPRLQAAWTKSQSSDQRPLTTRQIQIVRLIAHGYSSRQIAEQLKRSQSTIENHRSRILKRFGVKTSAEMVRQAEKEGLLNN